MTALRTIEDVCTQIVDCEHKTAPIDPNGEYFAVGTPAMRGNAINYSESRRISKETFISWTRRMLPQPGDLLFAREAPVGPVVLIPDTGNVAPGQRTMLLRPDPQQIDSRFLFYLLASPRQQELLLSKAAGSTVAHLNVADVRAFTLPLLPDLPQQQAIAEILGSLDDKIAANTKLAAAADSLATMQFHKLIDSVAISDRSFGDVALVSGGGTPSTKVIEYWDGEIPWATPTDVTPLQGPYLESTKRMISQAGLSACASSLYPAGSILMTSRATIGAFALAQTPMAVNQGFIVVQPTDPTLNFWVFHEMRSRIDEFTSLANGATFLELSRGNFKKFKVRLADPSVMEEFGRMAENLHAVARNALCQNTKLAATRDTLLPQLMSGKLRVKGAEKVLENAGL